MTSQSRRTFLKRSAYATVASTLVTSGRLSLAGSPKNSSRILVGTGKGTGDHAGSILAFHWDSGSGTLTPEGVAADLPDSTWLEISPDRHYLYVASELATFNGQPTGAVSSFKMGEKLQLLSQVNSASVGTCQVGVDHTGNVVISADYGGGSAASFVSQFGKLSGPMWSEHYDGYADRGTPGGKGPVADRQEAAHAHFASVSPDNHFAFVNDLGGDQIHIYKMDELSGKMFGAGAYNARPGSGPRTLHFHPNGKVAYCVNELSSSVDVLDWNANDRAFMPIQHLDLLPAGEPKTTVNTGCDAALTRDGRYAYFANRGHDFLMSCTVDPKTGKLTPTSDDARTPTGGKTPRNFRLDITENWVLVANQDSDNLSVFARDPKTGTLAKEGKNTPCPRPMCIVFA